MLYILQVVVLLIVAPLVATVLHAVVGGHTLLDSATVWFVFFGGLRLLIAGISQALRPGFTVGHVLGQPDRNPGAEYMTQELGAANLGLGVLGVVAPWIGFAPAGALAIGVFLLLAGVRHLAKPSKRAAEWFATVTDVAVGALLLVLFVWTLIVR